MSQVNKNKSVMFKVKLFKGIGFKMYDNLYVYCFEVVLYRFGLSIGPKCLFSLFPVLNLVGTAIDIRRLRAFSVMFMCTLDISCELHLKRLWI